MLKNSRSTSIITGLFFSFLLLCAPVLCAAPESEGDQPFGSAFKIAVPQSPDTRFKDVEVSTLSTESTDLPAAVAEAINADGNTEHVDVLSLEDAAEAANGEAARDLRAIEDQIKAADSGVVVQKKSVAVELAPGESKFHSALTKYQAKVARPLWTILKCTTYALASWYIVVRTSGRFDFWAPMVIVGLGAFCAWKVEAINSRIENFRPVYSAINKNRSKDELSLTRKIASAFSRLVEPVIATTAFETILYFMILEYKDYRDSVVLQELHQSRSALEILGDSFHYGIRAFFSDYSMALAIQKALGKSKKSPLFKHILMFHTATFLAMATFMGNFAHSFNMHWTTPIMLTLTGVGTLAYAYLKIPVIKSLIAGILMLIPPFRKSPLLQKWLNDYDLSKDFVADFPPLEATPRKQGEKASKKPTSKGSCLQRIRLFSRLLK